jgi:hypothetical protein
MKRNKYLFPLSATVSVTLIAGIYFNGCRNFFFSIDQLPKHFIGLALVAYAFAVAASLLISIVQYFDFFQENQRKLSPTISRRHALLFLAGLFIYFEFLRMLAEKYCN